MNDRYKVKWRLEIPVQGKRNVVVADARSSKAKKLCSPWTTAPAAGFRKSGSGGDQETSSDSRDSSSSSLRAKSTSSIDYLIGRCILCIDRWAGSGRS